MSADPIFESPTVLFEQLLLTATECFVYKVPPLKSANGHRAEEWDLANPLFTGALRIFQIDTKLKIAIYSYKDPTTILLSNDNLNVFAESLIEVEPKGDITLYVDGVIDSSRYYVLRLRDPKNPSRTAFIGIGFRERETSFDFKNALNDYVRFVDRMAAAAEMAAARARGEFITAESIEHSGEDNRDLNLSQTQPGPIKDYSIKHGEKIKIKSKLFKTADSSSSSPTRQQQATTY